MLTESDNIEPAVIHVARSHGLTLREEMTTAKGPVRALVFDAPGCGQPVVIALLSVTFEEEPILAPVREQRDVVRYVYFDRTWNLPDRLAVFFEWKKHKALALFGLTQYVPSRFCCVLRRLQAVSLSTQ